MTINNTNNAVLFDLDGTLLDTADDLGAALNFVLKKYKLPTIAQQIFRPVASDGALGLLKLGFKEQLNDFNYDQLREDFLSYYQNNIASHTRLYLGVNDLLRQLDQENIPWGIVTNKPEGLTRLLLPHFDALSSCKVIVGGDTLAKRKPDPEPVLYACQQMKTQAKQCLYVGDALRDIQAGNSANMTTIVAHWGYIKSTDNCRDWQADYIHYCPTDLLDLLFTST
jgi:phosphoglycolate phosphatase